MSILSRRRFIHLGGAGLALAGAGELILPAGAEATSASGDLGDYGQVFQAAAKGQGAGQNNPRPAQWAATEDNILGPYHRRNAPFRAKVTPPLEPGTVLLISGRVFGLDTRKPLPNTVIDIWQANRNGRYDNDDPKNPPAAHVFTNRCRLVTDDQGYYEYETIHPGPYRIDAKTWRPPHIHYWVRATGYRELVTQLYFRGDQHQKGDNWIRDSLIIDLRETKNAHGAFKTGTFDIILPALPRRQ